MRKSIGYRAFVVIALIGSVFAPQQSVHAGVGRTPGSASVTQSGAFSYHIPIWAPPGPGGIQPNLSLEYNSQAGNGPLGVGWSLGGLSSLTRCNRTVAQDGSALAV